MRITTIVTSAACVLAFALPAAAQQDQVYNRHGEISVGTQAPTVDTMVRTIEEGSTEALVSVLEYGERVQCFACIPKLQGMLLTSNVPRKRELAAWWLRRQPFGLDRILVQLRSVVSTDEDPVRRARAAEAMGEIMDPAGLATLSDAALEDTDAGVRAAAVRALGRMNHATASAVIASAFSDGDRAVRLAAMDQVLRVNHFQSGEELVGLLADDDVEVRKRAAKLTGELREAAAEPALIGLLRGDSSAPVRQAAAWALGRIGGATGREAISEAMGIEEDRRVRDALRIAEQMPLR